MRYKPDDVLLWESRDGILKSGQEYLVWETREGWRGQEFTLKHTDHQKVEPMIYFPVFLVFLGLPIWTSRMAPKADLSYKTARDMGSIPAFWRRFRTLSGFILRTFAISSRVYPSIFIISDYGRKRLKNILKFRIFFLTSIRNIGYYFNIGWLPVG